MSPDWVPLKACHARNDAILLRSLLESEGIQCFIPDEHTSAVLTWNPTPITVFVQKKDFDRAEELANASDGPADPAE